MKEEKVYIEGYEVGFSVNTSGTRENRIQVASGDIVSIDENFVYKSIEPQKVKVPQFMADWIEYFKKYSGSLYGSTVPYSYYGHAITDDFVGNVKKTLGWIRNNSETYARAWLDGYEVEKEKRYTVKIKGEIEENKLVYGLGIERYFFAKSYDSSKRGKHTRKELEEANFGWVFDCPGIEIEEVEE